MVALVSFGGLLEGVERWAYNVHFDLRGPMKPKTPIVIVSIDEDSFDELVLQWPWPRALHGQFLDIASRGKPAAIGFDIVFSEPSSTGSQDDREFAEAVGRAGNVVLGSAFTEVKGPYTFKENLNPPIAVLRQQAAAYGFVTVIPDEDAFVRSTMLTRVFQSVELSSFDLHLYRLGVKAGIRAAPLPLTRSILINYQGRPHTFLTIPYYQVLQGEVKPDLFAGSIVLIGSTSPVLHDVFPTAFAPRGNMPGVEIHANILETLFQGVPLSRISAWVVVVLTLIGGGLGVWVTDRMRPLPALSLILFLATVYTVATFAMFVGARLWMDVAGVPAALILGYGATVVENFIREQRAKQRLSRYFSPAVVAEIVRQKEDANLASARRRMTVLFTDIRGFTSMSEKMTPEDVVTFLREYFTVVTNAVFQHGGTVDKYIGDGVMALYNVPFDQPDHAAQAVRTALESQENLKPLAGRFRAKYGTDLSCGVGIHTGDAVVGTIGSEQRLEYTAIGDTINLGSRLEGITKDFHVSIIISESTYEEVKGQFITRYLGEVKIKGKEIPVKIYAIAESSRRQSERIAVKITVMILDAEVTLHAPVIDLSRGGLAAYDLPKGFTVGQVLPLQLEAQDGALLIGVKGKVVWTSGEKVGFSFVDLTPRDVATLERLMAAYGSANPLQIQ